MPPIDEKKIIETNQPPKSFTQDELKAFVSENIQKYTDEQLKKTEDKITSKIDAKETRTTEVLAIFITLFTFISVNVNIFSKVTDIKRAIFFMILMTICSLVLLSFCFIAINDQKRNWFQWGALLVCLFFLAFMICVTQFLPSLNVAL